MRLKHLELQGFKTFASKTEFVFPSGIAAIVGPNGSGKSNVADALRWVLGEQVFSVLRAKRTEDLIFAGGEGRPRAGMAEVYLTFDNSDSFFPVEFDEVVIGRRAYRDGENEYLINSSKVRLRDVSELLGKTGLARRTYTVIGQGLVDQALALGSDERRALFEEAAGISMYRHKREEALRKLDETRRNLDRVRDIIAEIGPRVRQLERQAQRTRDYARLSSELSQMQRVWFGYHWGKGQAALREAKNTVEAHSARLNLRRSDLGGFHDRIETVRTEQHTLRVQVNDWQQASNEVRVQAEALQRQLAVWEERARSLQQQSEQALGECATLEAESAAQAERVAQAEADLAEIVARYDTQASAIAAARQALADRQAQRQAVQRSRTEAHAAIQQAELALADRRNRRAQLHERRSKLESDQAAHAADVTNQRQAQIAFEQQGAVLADDLATLNLQHGSLTQQIETMNAELEDTQRQVAQAETALDEARAEENRWRERFAVLSDVRASLAGFDQGTRTVMSAQLAGVRGVLAALIEVDPEWERAVEAALGPDIQAIVVDSWEAAQHAREHLGDGNGRVSLLMLDGIDQSPHADSTNPLGRVPSTAPGCLPFGAWLQRSDRSADAGAQPMPGVLPDGVRPAIDCVACQAELRPAIENLLKHVVIVASLDEARALRARLPEGFHIATRAGEVLRANGVVTTGRTTGSGEFLAREREWRELPARIDLAAQATAYAHHAHETVLAEIDQLTRRRAAVNDQTRSLDQAIESKTDERREIDRQLGDLQRTIDWKQGLIAQVAGEIAVIDRQDAELQTDETQIQMEVTAQQAALAQAETQLAELSTEELAAQLTALQAEAAISEQLRRSQTNVVNSYRSGLEQVRGQLQGRRQRAQQIEQEQSAIGQQLAEVRQREAAFQDRLTALAAQIDPAEARRRALEVEHDRLESEERAARNRLSDLETVYNQAMLDLARKEEELNHLRTRIDEELGLVQLEMADLSGPQPLPLKPIVSELPTVDELPEGMEQELQRMKAHIRRLGPINPEAQAEYEEVRGRFEFLTQQSSDLEQAITQLQQVIAELDQMMETAFRETFDQIAEEFRGMFQQLFGGGSAKLVLTDPENMSVTGVDVMARPPGKKQQGLALLSGGERSLTAAALMFAILKVKPPPFCILDETDAALDEANVGRFRDTLKSLSAQTQFVIITHNRGTIEAADTIYGISMGADSASRAISLELEAIQKQA